MEILTAMFVVVINTLQLSNKKEQFMISSGNLQQSRNKTSEESETSSSRRVPCRPASWAPAPGPGTPPHSGSLLSQAPSSGRWPLRELSGPPSLENNSDHLFNVPETSTFSQSFAFKKIVLDHNMTKKLVSKGILY